LGRFVFEKLAVRNELVGEFTKRSSGAIRADDAGVDASLLGEPNHGDQIFVARREDERLHRRNEG
jgi:hypothetical protein